MVALFNGKSAAVIERLQSIITSVCGQAPRSNSDKTVWGLDVLCLGPALPQGAVGNDGSVNVGTNLPIYLFLKVKRNGSLSHEWHTCTKLARACYEALQDLGSITDVHCLVVEADLVAYQGNGKQTTCPASSIQKPHSIGKPLRGCLSLSVCVCVCHMVNLAHELIFSLVFSRPWPWTQARLRPL